MRDFALNDDNDIYIENGDFVFNDRTDKDIELLLFCVPGQNRYQIYSGINIISYLNSNKTTSLYYNIKKTLADNGIYKTVVYQLDRQNSTINFQII